MAGKPGKLLLVILLAALANQPAAAKIIKTARVDCKTDKICLYWWPELPAIKGWHTDIQVNYDNGNNGANFLIPDGFNFANAETVMYAEAIYKPRYKVTNPNSKTLDAFIADDKASFSSAVTSETSPLKTGDGQKLRSFTYFRPKDKNWERVSYGEEGDYYLLFVVNSNSDKSYRSAQRTYENLIAHYKQ